MFYSKAVIPRYCKTSKSSHKRYFAQFQRSAGPHHIAFYLVSNKGVFGENLYVSHCPTRTVGQKSVPLSHKKCSHVSSPDPLLYITLYTHTYFCLNNLINIFYSLLTRYLINTLLILTLTELFNFNHMQVRSLRRTACYHDMEPIQ